MLCRLTNTKMSKLAVCLDIKVLSQSCANCSRVLNMPRDQKVNLCNVLELCLIIFKILIIFQIIMAITNMSLIPNIKINNQM